MRNVLVVIIACIVHLSAQNQAPFFVSLISPSGDNADSVKIPFQLADAENDVCTLTVSYSLDNGMTWIPATITNTIFQSNNPVYDTVIWTSYDNLGIRDFEEAMLQLIPYDADIGTPETTTVFSINNFSLYDYRPFFPATAIDSIGFTRALIINGTENIAYTFKGVNSNVCSLALNYSVDNGVNWLHATSSIKQFQSTSGKDTITWDTKNDLQHVTCSNALLKIPARDTVRKRDGLAPAIGFLALDNEAPSFFWVGGVVDTNIILLHFPDDIDSTKVLETSRYTMNFGRTISAVYRNSNINALITIAYSLKGGPEQPDFGEDIEVYYYSSTNSWVKVRTIRALDVETWTHFKDSITDVNAFHPRFRVKFMQTDNSGIDFDNYYLDDIIISKNNSILFSDSIPSSEIDTSKWKTIVDVITTSDYIMSPPYALKFEGSSDREIQTDTLTTGSEIGIGACNYYAETNLPLLPSVPYNVIIDTLFDTTGNFSLTPISDTFTCRSDLLLPGISLSVSSPALKYNATINYKLTDPDSDRLDITSIEYKVPGGQWQEATVSGTITNIPDWNYERYFTWRTGDDLPGQHIHNVSLRARVNDTTLEGSFDMLTGLEVNNNNPPQITLTRLSPLYSDTTIVGFTISDQESDTVNLDIFFSNDKKTWYPAQTTNNIKNITSSSYDDSFKWMTLDDVKPPNYDMTGVLFLKVTPKDYAFGASKTLEIPINSSVLPTLVLGTVSGEQHDTVTISYVIHDKDNSTISLKCHYSPDGGTTWYDATTTNPLSSITSANYTGSIQWLSQTDLPGEDNNSVYFRAIPFDPEMGIGSTTNRFHVDNNEPPTAFIFQDMQGTQTNDVPMKVLLSDYEFDILRLTFQYKEANSSSWQYARIKESLSDYDSSEYNGKTLTFTWRGNYDVSNYADSIWIRVAAIDADNGPYSSDIGFYYSDKGPDLKVSSIEHEQVGDVPIPFDITSNSLDSVTIECQYKITGSSWKEATCSGIMKYPHSADSGFILWKSYDDLGNIDHSSVIVRLRGISHKTGGMAHSNYFSINNNRAPSANLLKNPVVTISKVYLKSLFTDYEYDKIKICLQYMEESSSTWRRATVSEPTGTLDSADYAEDTVGITWESSDDIPDFTDSILVRLAAFDTDTGLWDIISFHLGQQAPDIYLYATTTEQSDTVPVPFRILYNGKDTVSLKVQYSINDSSWRNATLVDSAVFQEQTSADTLQWLSNTDLPHRDIQKVWIRIKPSAKFKGVWKKGFPFHLDNNLPPQVYFTDETKMLEQTLLPIYAHMSFTVSDSESDTVSNACLIRAYPNTANKTFQLPEDIDTVTSDMYENSSFSFNYTHDSYGDSMDVRFILSSADNDEGNSDTLSLILRRFLGDFNCNGYVDLVDLKTFILAWKFGDFSKNTGPVKGNFPNITVEQDSLFNLEDLSAFVISWNYSRKHITKYFEDDMLVESDYVTKDRQTIYKADRDLFQTELADSFSISNISVIENQPFSYVIQISLPNNDVLSEGILLSFPENITIDSATGLSGDFTVNCYNNTHTEVLLYSASILSDYSTVKQTAKLYISVKDPTSAMIMNIRYHALSKRKVDINKAAHINLNNVTNVINETTHPINVKVGPNPFTPDITLLPETIQKLTGIYYGTVIIVEKPEDYIAGYNYFIGGRISIFDMLGNFVVKEMPLSKDETGNLFFIWKGYNRNNRIVSNGSYKAIISTKDTSNGELIHTIIISVKK